MKPRKVIFVNRFFYPDHSATSQILSDLVFDLARDGVAVEIITSRMRYDDPAAVLAADEGVLGVRVHRVWSTRFGRGNLLGRAIDYISFYLGAFSALMRHVGRGSIVVAKTDPPLLSLVVAPVVKFRGAVLINWLQDLFPEVAGALGVKLVQGPVMGGLRWARNITLRSALTNVVLGSRMHELVTGLDVPSSQVKIIHNWADGEAIQPVSREVNPLRKAWGIDERFVVGYSGNLGRAHEFVTVLDAAEQLRERHDVMFLFIGGGAQRDKVEHEAQRRGLSNVMFQPYQPRERLGESLSVSDVHLVSLNPALEGLIVPSKFYGIAAAGRPTLFIGDVDGEIPRLLREGDCGYAVPGGDADGLAKHILELASDSVRCFAMGGNARALFEQRFDRKHAVEAWKDVLSLLSKKS
ncbi:MAG: glycosyltransferase family 4 protein [Gammaproteobacteria bacterium]|nr:glycosyltransferase family 4 protein [Gammaproteobacteria bacterium]MCW8840449.1 glycosyltransferase family 4 protein [Gammaproteobacteria bacterium]MCW8959145.1 glycosyltransferase family 4 protein [Gammaproteobacteria bacterium]MCW8993300.1 glycosyltransferase family 4 protein [Gammaproteobacteria bacterium]